jgi:hypothetical protein
MGNRNNTEKEALSLGCRNVAYRVGGRSLSDLNITLVPGIKSITFTNVGSWTIFIDTTAADGHSFRLLPNAWVTVKLREGMAARLRFYARVMQSSNMNFEQEGD